MQIGSIKRRFSFQVGRDSECFTSHQNLARLCMMIEIMRVPEPIQTSQGCPRLEVGSHPPRRAICGCTLKTGKIICGTDTIKALVLRDIDGESGELFSLFSSGQHFLDL